MPTPGFVDTQSLAALAVAVIPVLGAAQNAAADPSSSARPARSATTGFVAMGDSYSSGEGTGVYYPESNSASNRCHRSPLAYAPLLKAGAKRLGPLTFVACSGAVTRDLYQASSTHPGEGAQLDALRKRTKVVTLTIGGNDAVFAPVVTACVQSAASVTPAFGCSKSAALNGLVDARLAALSGHSPSADPTIVPIRKVLTDIHARSPRARIYLAGYPELFGDRTAHFSVDQTAPSGSSCVVNPALAARVDYADTQWINDRTRELNGVFRTAVRQARSSGIKATYVSPSTFDGHGLCDRAAAWIQPVLVSPPTTILSESLHPTAEGQRKGYLRAFQRAGL